MRRLCLLLIIIFAFMPIKALEAQSKSLDGYVSPYIFMPPIEWAGLDNTGLKERAYLAGVIDGYSFFLFGAWPRQQDYAQQFSDFRFCVDMEMKKKLPFPRYNWVFAKSLKASQAAILLREAIPNKCIGYAGEGDGSWEPISAFDPKNWGQKSLDEQKWYVSGFLEMHIELFELSRDEKNLKKIIACSKAKGLETFVEKMRAADIETGYPLPWSFAPVLGQICSEF